MNGARQSDVYTLVIGAGVAGATAALAAARAIGSDRQRRVLLVDRATWPRNKVCGCCLGARGVGALTALGVPMAGLRSLSLPLNEVHVRSGRGVMALPLRGGIVIGRRELDGLIVKHAVEAGAEFEPGCTAKVLRRETGGVAGGESWHVQLTSSTGERVIRAAVVIVAEGLAGRSLELVEDAAGLGVSIRHGSRMGVGAQALWGEVRWMGATSEHERDALPCGRVVLCTGRHGYVGLVRLRDGAVDIAAALDPRAIKDAGGPVQLMERVLKVCGLKPDGVWPVKVAGTGLLTRQRLCVAAPGLLIAGDAAGYVEPFTGEGMTWAACGGSMAGQLAATCAPNEAAARWRVWHRQQIAARQRVCGVLTGALRLPGAAALATWAVRWLPPARAAANQITTLIGGPVHQGELA